MIAPIMALISPAANVPEQGGDEPADQGRHTLSVVAPGRRDPRAYLLLFRYLVLNLVAVGLLAAAWLQGWLDVVLAADETRLVVVIAGVFLAGLLMCTQRIWRVSWELNQARTLHPHPASRVARYLAVARSRTVESRSLAAAAMRAKLSGRIAIVRHMASTLVLLGLIGTVIGFIIALSGVKPETAASAEAVAPMIATLIAGMSIALYTTLVGAVLNIWLMANYYMLAGGTTNLLAAIVERGEADAGH